MANKIYIIENLKDEIDTSEVLIRDFVIDWYATQFTQNNCKQVNDMLHGFLSELDYIKSIVDTNLPALEKQITTEQDALEYNLFHAKCENFMQVMNGLAAHLLASLSNPETYFCEEYFSHLNDLATKFGHYPQWTQYMILNKVLDLISDHSDLPKTPDPTATDMQDDTPQTFENTQEVDSIDQTLGTQDNTPAMPIDTPRHSMVNHDLELNFELDSELNFEFASEPNFELDPELDADINFEPGNQAYFNMPQHIELAGTPSDPIETNDNIPPPPDNSSPSNTLEPNGPPDFDNESNMATDSDFDIDSDSDLDSSFEDLEGTFLTICEAIKKNIPPRRPIPTFSFG